MGVTWDLLLGRRAAVGAVAAHLQIGANDSIVGEGTQVGKSTVKRTLLGRHCKIGDKVRAAWCPTRSLVAVM
jgi:hypothetical protein